MYKKDMGIILNSHDSVESDKIVIIFLKESGKMSFVFKGVRKSKSKKLNSADLGNCVELFYYQKSNNQLPYIREIKVQNHFVNIKNNHIKYLYLHYIAELFSYLLPEHQPNIKLYNFLGKVLKELEKIHEKDLEKLMVYTQFRIIQASGILPEFNFCHDCGERESLIYKIYDNEIYCENCVDSVIQHDISINQDLKNALAQINQSRIRDLKDLIIDSDLVKNMDIIFKNIIYKYINVELKSYKILKKILKDIE